VGHFLCLRPFTGYTQDAIGRFSRRHRPKVQSLAGTFAYLWLGHLRARYLGTWNLYLELESGLPLFASCREEVFSETEQA
jgi:hypothetical protein